MNDDSLTAIRRFGDPVLNVVCEPCGPRDVAGLATRMLRTVHAFRLRHGWGRAIAAPQVGEAVRLVAMAIDGRETVLVDPIIEWRSEAVHELWDDCMSLPEIAVRVLRHERITVRYRTLDGAEAAFERADPDLSELLQHEIDHLDGVLMTRRMVPTSPIVAHENRHLFSTRHTPQHLSKEHP